MAVSLEASTNFLTLLEAGLRRCEATSVKMLMAVSGGADSVALLRGLVSLRDSFSLELRAAHLNHQLRGTDADADADWVKALCKEHDVLCDIEAAPILALAEESRRGLEETAREVRYKFLQTIAARHQCDVVAVAHTADDQAETVLHHILRGTGLTGLRGMEWSRSFDEAASSLPDSLRLIRPMLAIWRTDIQQFLADLRQDFREDKTNADISLTRNRLRHDLIPRLEQEFNPRVREHLCQIAEQAGATEEALAIAANALLDAAMLDRSDNVARLRRDSLARVSRHLAREVFVRLWHRLNWPRQAMTFSHWDRLADLVQSDRLASLNLPGPIVARRRANLLVIQREI